MKTHQRPIALGIDIGTTKVAAALVDADTREVLATVARSHESDVEGLPAGRSEQVASRILATLDECMDELPRDERASVVSIGVTGQMHGVVLWNSDTGATSHLVTWQDQRCVEDSFLDELRVATGDGSIQTGYGLATVSWYARRSPEFLARFTRASTIHDFLVSKIAESPLAVTDPSDAASWGFFDMAALQWDLERIKKAGIPLAFLPEVRPGGDFVGALGATYATKWGIPAGVPIANAIGDNQASLFGSLTDPEHQMALTIGTGAQLSVVVPALPRDDSSEVRRHEYRPYIGKSYIAVAASLSGGRALAALGRAVREFLEQAGISSLPSLDSIQSAMHAAGLERIETDLIASASLSGERYAPHLRGSFTNLSFDNFSIGDMTAALSRGLVKSLRDALPPQLLDGRRTVVGSGNAIRRSPLMQQIIREVFGCSLVLTEGSETTACGVALLAGRSFRRRG